MPRRKKALRAARIDWKDQVEEKRKDFSLSVASDCKGESLVHSSSRFKATFEVMDSAIEHRQIHVVILGIGSALQSSISKYQLAWCLEFVNELGTRHRQKHYANLDDNATNAAIDEATRSCNLDVCIYDPMLVPDASDCNTSSNNDDGFTTIGLGQRSSSHDNSSEYRQEIFYYEKELGWAFQDYFSCSKSPPMAIKKDPFKIFIMFHCPHHLYNKVLSLCRVKEPTLDQSQLNLENFVLLGNDLTEYMIDSKTTPSSPSQFAKYGHVYSSKAALDDRYTKSDFEFNDFHSNVFTGSYWQSWTQPLPSKSNDQIAIVDLDISIAGLSLS